MLTRRLGLRKFLRNRVVKPVLDVLRYGATPERLAWSIAVGMVVGVNPLLGSTTVAALAVASGLRLNVVASQLGNHVVYPAQLLLFPVFVAMGSWLFRTASLPLGMHVLLAAAKLHPWETTRMLWMWEWHALVVWAGVAVIVAPILKVLLKPALEKMLDRLHHEPVVEK